MDEGCVEDMAEAATVNAAIADGCPSRPVLDEVTLRPWGPDHCIGRGMLLYLYGCLHLPGVGETPEKQSIG